MTMCCAIGRTGRKDGTMNETSKTSEFVSLLTRMNEAQRDQLREIMADMIRKNEQTQEPARAD